MTNHASHWASQIQWEAVRDQPILNARFPDDSVLTISTAGKHKRMGTQSAAGSQAHAFANAIEPKTGFDITAKGLVFTFRDGSQLDLALEGSTLFFHEDPDAE